MKISLSFLLVTLLVSACKFNGGDSAPVEQNEGKFGEITVLAERNFTPSELLIGRRICGALKSKRELFESLDDRKEKFRFRGEVKNCNVGSIPNIGEFNASISNTNSASLEYISERERTNYFKDIVTDTSGVMNILCDNINKKDIVSNQILSGSSYIRFNFLIEKDYDQINIIKKSKDNEGKYRTVSAESVSVITQLSQAPAKFRGVEKERALYSLCSTPKVFSHLKQTWMTAITDF